MKFAEDSRYQKRDYNDHILREIGRGTRQQPVWHKIWKDVNRFTRARTEFHVNL